MKEEIKTAPDTGAKPDYEAAALEGQKALNEEIAINHVTNIGLIRRLEKLGGDQNYAFTIKKALEVFGGEVAVAVLSEVLPDSQALAKARRKLEDEGVIKETTVKNRKTLHLVETA